ncbi:2'-5' RNA ligase family protein [Burkholderiaceae bacterium UC74_6]
MSGQGSLFDDEPARVAGTQGGGRKQDLFFALMPPQQLAQDIAARIPDLSGAPADPQRLHITLCDVAEVVGQDLPDKLIRAAKAAAATLAHAPLAVRLDQLQHFTKAVVLVGSGNERVTQFARLLGRALKQYGMAPKVGSTPHLTLFYTELRRHEPRPVEPILWTATDFVLLVSHVGQSRYDELGRWPLVG